MNDVETRDEILEHAARAFFASAWADYCEEIGESLSHCEILDVMPETIDPAAVDAANALVAVLEKKHGIALPEIFRRAVKISEAANDGDRERTPEMFGHYAAMGAMGHGVGLWDALGDDANQFVGDCHMEFSMFDLDCDKYPIPESTE